MPKSAPFGSTTAARDQDGTCAPGRRGRHGDRSVPPPLAFDIYELPDSALLTSRDVAAVGRWAVSTVERWRQRPGHPLQWLDLPGGFKRTTVGYLKAFLASGAPRNKRTSPPVQGQPRSPRREPAITKPAAVPPPRRGRRTRQFHSQQHPEHVEAGDGDDRNASASPVL
jgi:hypothetical protein